MSDAEKRSWRDLMPIHPAADMFPMLDDADLLALGEDIGRNGLTSPIVVQLESDWPVLLDGRNRLDAMECAGWKLGLSKCEHGSWFLTIDDARGGTGNNAIAVVTTDPWDYVVSANIHRRHLTPESKRALIAQLLKENPERSDRAIGKLVKADNKTVASVRRQEEDVRNVPHVKKRVDTRGRRQPAKKRAATGEKVSAKKQTVIPAARKIDEPLAPNRGSAVAFASAKEAERTGLPIMRCNWRQPQTPVTDGNILECPLTSFPVAQSGSPARSRSRLRRERQLGPLSSSWRHSTSKC